MKPLYRKWALCITLALLLSYAHGQLTVEVGEHFRQESLDRQVQLLEDATKRLTLWDVAHRTFRPQKDPSINVGFSNSFYWVKFKLHNPDAQAKELLLEIENPHINKLRLFTLAGNRWHVSMLTGDHFPYSQRIIEHPHFLFPITVRGHQSITGYLWVDKHGEQIQIPLRLWDKAYFNSHSYQLYLVAGFMIGIGSLYCVACFLALLFFRQRIILYYFFYLSSIWLFMIAHTGFGFALLWSESTWWTSVARPATALLIYLSSYLFIQDFFNLRQTRPYLYWYTNVLLALLTIALVTFGLESPALGLFENYWYNPHYYSGESLLQFMILIHILYAICITSVPFICLYIFVKTREPEGLWAAFGFMMILFSATNITFVHAGYLPDNYITQNIPLASTIIDAIILSVLIANRFKNIFLQNAQISAELAEQRQRNAIRLLEGQVIERSRLSQELHDGISLTLANIRLRLSLLSEKLNGHQPEAEQLVEALGDVGQDVRQFSHALSPVLLERYGLVGALEELIEDVRSSHPELTLSLQAESIRSEEIPPLVNQTIYQVALELLNNATKHAHASQITVALKQTDNKLMLIVSDDGLGYDVAEKSAGIGLQNVTARIQLLNGQLTVHRLPKGMEHVVDIPVQIKLFS
ncbi:hypothetical protein IC229_25110 [Spirosoma sp. BT702]|uniref:Histidine kinase domain-containing protein n=1 Tax=Spirosoma profusum TaxID=2771354 RepID=A0A927APC4_9BACT|nr:7TM-DISM domain-containing protein [Spirosoma profusum]MBD2703949.1 hypothetical protein [Spirosoma profusum]